LDKLEKERLEILEGAIHVEGKPEKIDKKGKK
jgi:hypothetical protein